MAYVVKLRHCIQVNAQVTNNNVFKSKANNFFRGSAFSNHSNTASLPVNHKLLMKSYHFSDYVHLQLDVNIDRLILEANRSYVSAVIGTQQQVVQVFHITCCRAEDNWNKVTAASWKITQSMA